jgi:vacuolar-type H+-ATPase subunit F/Vma7
MLSELTYDTLMSTTNHYRLAIVGPTDMVSGFQALGVEAYNATNPTEALEQLRAIKKISNDSADERTYAVVCVIDDVLKDIDQAEYAKVVAGALPAVVVLPGPNGASGVAVERLRLLAQKAVGSSII